MKAPLPAAALLAALAAIPARALELRLDYDIPLDDRTDSTRRDLFIRNIEAARDLWAGLLGFDRCYPGAVLKVTVRKERANDHPADAFMSTAPWFSETSPGSRRLAPSSSGGILFKDQPYRQGSGANEDGTWFLAPDPLAVGDALWPAPCKVFEKPCASPTLGAHTFDYFSHIAHEFGHALGFVGEYLAFGQVPDAGGGIGTFSGLDPRGQPYGFTFSGNTSHAQTSVMSLGFSAKQRGLPNAQEVDALQQVLGYAGTHFLVDSQVAIPAHGNKVVTLAQDSAFAVGTAEFASQYRGDLPAGCGDATVSLEGPAGTKAALGPLRSGWALAGYARPDNALAPSYNPPDSLSRFHGQAARGNWKVTYANAGASDCRLAEVALRLTEDAPPAALGRKAPPSARPALALAAGQAIPLPDAGGWGLRLRDLSGRVLWTAKARAGSRSVTAPALRPGLVILELFRSGAPARTQLLSIL